MPHPLSLLGVAHTAISLVPVLAGLYSLARYRSIEPATRSGKIYLAGLALSVLTSFGLSSTGSLNPGHVIGILALLAAFGSLLIPRWSFLGWLRPYLSTFGLSFSFFLTLVPGIVETLTRLPQAHPLAEGPQSPLVSTALLVWVITFITGFTLQVLMVRSRRRTAAASQTSHLNPPP